MSERDAAAAAAGLAPLRETALPEGEREVRLWTGAALGYPHQLYRVRTIDGRTEGALFLYWKVDDDPSRPDSLRYEERVWEDVVGTCRERTRRGDIEACRARFTREPDWAAILAAADSAGLRTLPDEDAMRRSRGLQPRLVIDGWSMTGEVREGARYRRFLYRSPHPDPAAPEYAAAISIVRAFGSADALLELPEQLRVLHRGRWVAGPGTSEFQPCGAESAWALSDLRQPAEPRPAPGVAWYVEARGFDSLVGANEPRRTLAMVELLADRPWDPALCAREPLTPPSR